jgi:hypothetical protein
MEVHPPEHPIFTWKQFFIHMSTICLGLLIALGLEHVAELIHEHEQLKQANEALEREIRANILVTEYETIEIRRQHDIYAGDLADLEYLRSHPHTSLDKLPAPLYWGFLEQRPSTAAWDTLRSGPVAALKPVSEMESTAQLYQLINQQSQAQDRAWGALVRVQTHVSHPQDPRNLSPAVLDQWIADVRDLLGANYNEAITLQNLCEQGASFGFKPCFSRPEVRAWINLISDQQLVSLYGASAQSFLEKRNEVRAQEKAIDHQLETLDSTK